jgi:hypothetical protein
MTFFFFRDIARVCEGGRAAGTEPSDGAFKARPAPKRLLQRGYATRVSGSRTVKQAPGPSRLLAVAVPPWASAI